MDNDVLGVVGTDVPLAPLIESLKEIEIKIEDSSVAVLTGGGMYLVDTRNPEKNLQSYLKDPVSRYWSEIMTGKPFVAIVHEDGKKLLKVFNPISVPGIDEHWSFVISLPYNTILRGFYLNIGLIVLFTLILIFSISYINKIILSKILSPLEENKAKMPNQVL
jgi:hypothetical protein